MSTRHVKLVADVRGNMNSELNKIGGGLDSLMKKFAVFAIAQRVVKAAFNETVRSIQMSIDAQEDMNKFLVVMGENSDWVSAELDDMSESTNRNVNELRAMTAAMQDLLVPAGLARDVAADMSVKFVTLATDVSSFNNVPVVEVMGAIRSAIAGSTEPLRRFGVDTRIASLEALALSMGITESWQSMSQANKTMVLYNKLVADTADAQGDAARTAGDAASLLILFQSKLDEARVAIGDNFIPVLEKLIPLLVDELGGGFDLVNDAAATFAEMIDEVGPVVIERMGDLIWVLQELKGIAELLPEPLSNIVQQLADMASPLNQLGFLWDNSIGLMHDAEQATDQLAEAEKRLGETQRELQITMVDMQRAIDNNDIPALMRMREELQNMEFGEHADQIQGINDALGNMTLATISATVATMDNAIAFAERANAMTGNLGLMDDFVARLKEQREEMAQLGIEAMIAENTMTITGTVTTAGGGGDQEDPEMERLQRLFEKRIELERLAKEEQRTAEEELNEQILTNIEEQQRREIDGIRYKREQNTQAANEIAELEEKNRTIVIEGLQKWGVQFGKIMMAGGKGAEEWGNVMIAKIKQILLMKGIEAILNLVTSGVSGKATGFLGGLKSLFSFQGGGKPPLKAQGGLGAIPGASAYGSARGDVMNVLVDPTETILTQTQMQDRAVQSGGGNAAQIYIDFNSTLPASAAQKAELVPIVIDAFREAGIPI